MLIAFKLALLNLNLENNLPDVLIWPALALALFSGMLFLLTSHNSSKLHILKESLQAGKVEIAARCVIDMHRWQEFSWELVADALAHNLPNSLPSDAEKLVQGEIEELPQKSSDMQLCLSILILSRWLALASFDDTLACAKYWHYQGLAYSFLLKDSNQTNMSAAIACYQTSVQFYERHSVLEELAEIHYDLGFAYASLIRGDIQANLHIAIAYFSKALLYYKEQQGDKISSRRAQINYQLGLAYKGLLVRDQQRALDVSHQHLKDAISFYNQDVELKSSNAAEITATALSEVYNRRRNLICARPTDHLGKGEM